MTDSKPKLLLAYSGGLDTSVILKWLCEKGFEVIAFCANVGQYEEDFSAIKTKAVNCGAFKCVVTDLRKDFVDGYVFEAIKSTPSTKDAMACFPENSTEKAYWYTEYRGSGLDKERWYLPHLLSCCKVDRSLSKAIND